MRRIEKLVIDQKQILVIDYSDSSQGEMIQLLEKAKEKILQDNRPVLLLSIFQKGNYITPMFIRQFEKDYREVEKFVLKNAVIGLSDTQRWILKGVNLWTQRQIIHFYTREEAIQYLLEEKNQ